MHAVENEVKICCIMGFLPLGNCLFGEQAIWKVYGNICGDVGYVSTSWCYFELSKLGINTIATWTKLAEVSGDYV